MRMTSLLMLSAIFAIGGVRAAGAMEHRGHHGHHMMMQHSQDGQQHPQHEQRHSQYERQHNRQQQPPRITGCEQRVEARLARLGRHFDDSKPRNIPRQLASFAKRASEDAKVQEALACLMRKERGQGPEFERRR